MNPEFNGLSDVTFFNIETGEKVGEMKSISLEKEEKKIDTYSRNHSTSATLTLENANIDYNHLNELLLSEDPTYDVILSSPRLEKYERILNKTKKKRIKKKAAKKITELYHPLIGQKIPMKLSQIEFK